MGRQGTCDPASIVTIATGVPNNSFGGGTQANAYVEKYSLTDRELPDLPSQESTDQNKTVITPRETSERTPRIVGVASGGNTRFWDDC